MVVTAEKTNLKTRQNNVNLYTILHVDDEASTRNALQRQFRKSPFQIIQASQGAEALALAQEIHFDLAILDVSMPGMDGFKLLEKLREINPKLPAIMLTGLVEDFVLYRSIETGCDGFVDKPWDAEWLETKLQSVLKKHQRIKNQRIKKRLMTAKNTKRRY